MEEKKIVTKDFWRKYFARRFVTYFFWQ